MATVPGAPTITLVGRGQTINSMNVVFTPPVSDGGSPILFYEYRLNGGPPTNISPPTFSPFETYSGLSPLVTYAVEMRAYNAAGYSAWSAPVSWFTGNPAYSWTEDEQPITVQLMLAPSDPTPVSASFTFQTGSDYPLASYAPTSTTGPTANSFTVDGRRQANGIRWLISDAPGILMSDGSHYPLILNFQPYIATAPTITSITAGNAQLTVAFSTPVSDGGAPITDYQYTVDGGATVSSAGLVSPFDITGLTNGETYDVQVRAITKDIIEGEWSAVVQGEPLAPPAPPPPPAWAPLRMSAVGDRVVRVEFWPDSYAAPPVHASSTGEADALNPRAWNALQLYSDSPSPGGEPRTVLSVRMVDEWTYELLLLQPFRQEGTPVRDPFAFDARRHLSGEAQASGFLRFEDDSAATLSRTFSISIAAADLTPNTRATARGLSIKDYANASIAPVSSQIGGDYSEFLSGTLLINSAGDYATESGVAMVRKLVMRRLITKRGDFFHLPEYGAGLGVKETFSTANLRALAKDIEMQVMLEPEIERAKATLTYQASISALIVQVQARMRSTGQDAGVSFTLPLTGTTQF